MTHDRKIDTPPGIPTLIAGACLHCERLIISLEADLPMLSVCPFCTKPIPQGEGSGRVQ